MWNKKKIIYLINGQKNKNISKNVTIKYFTLL